MPAIDIDRDPAHAEAQRELAKSIYDTGSSPTANFSDWIDDWLNRLLTSAAEIPGAWFTITVLVIVLLVAVWVAIRMARRAMRTNRHGDHQLFDSGILSAAEHRDTAEACAANGDWAAAIRHRVRAVGRALEESGVLNQLPGRTANELARDAGVALPGVAAELARAADVFNDVAYGEQPGTEQGYRLVADLDDRLRARTPHRPTPVAAGKPVP